MRPSTADDIRAPELPPGLRWLNGPALTMEAALEGGAVLVEFWDFARIHSLRTLPYVKAWHERYAPAGLRVIGVHTPGYSFARDPDVAAEAVARLEIDYPVALDPQIAVWRLFANRGWPARYLFGRDGVLRYVHYGEGDYADCEAAIQEALRDTDPRLELPPLLGPLRPEDAPGARFEPQTADIALPGDRGRLELVRDWLDGEDYIEAADAGAGATVRSFTAGGAWAVLSGSVDPPGLYESDGTVGADDPGLRLHGFQFTPGSPVP